MLVPNFISSDIIGRPAYNKVERFNPELGSITTIDELEAYVDDSAASQMISTYSDRYTALLAYIISCRFYHGFSHFELSENWVAAVAEKCVGFGLASKVRPEDILEHPYAACSQQAIVMMEILRRKNIDYRKIGFPHHFALEARINKGWYFFDPDMEPNIPIKERLHENWKGNNDNLKRYYGKHGNVNQEFGNGVKAEIGAVNEIPAKNATIFQGITKVLSKILWCVPLMFVFVRQKRPFMYVVRPINHSPRPSNLRPIFSA